MDGMVSMARFLTGFNVGPHLKAEQWQHRANVSHRRVQCRLLLLQRDLRRAHHDATEDDVVQHADQAQAYNNPHWHEHHVPVPVDKAIQLQRQRDKLQRIDCQEELQLEGAIVLHGPNAGAHAHHRAEDQRDEDQHPQVAVRGQLIAGQQLEHQEDQVKG